MGSGLVPAGRRRAIGVAAAALAATVVGFGGGPARADAPLAVPADVAGPSWLHRPAASHPIVEPHGRWRAPALLVSGADAYVDGEYLFQDFLYDAHGANTTDVPLLPPDTSPSSATGLASAPTGDISPPTDPRFGGNPADLLEVRARLVDGGVAYRFTLNTMLAADAQVVALGIDADREASTGSDDWGAGVGSLGALGLEHVLVTWGTGATFNGAPIPSSADLLRNQIEVVVPIDPGVATWRHHAVTGVHDPATNGFAAIGEVPTGAAPGGTRATTPPPVLNVGFRRAADEPMGTDVTELGGRGVYGWGSWREHAQAKALASRDITRFGTEIDFGELRRGVTQSNVPAAGFLDRLYVSHLDLGEGVDGDRLLGPVQPYGLSIPEGLDPAEPAPFTLLLHAAACNYNQYGVQAPQLLAQLHEGRGGIVATPMGRGTTLGYGGIGEVDTFEMWADVARRHRLDFDRVAISGISMGGIGSFRLASLYPDLFTRAFPIAGHGAAVIDIADNLRNVPLLMWNGLPDELVRADQYLPYQRRLEELGYRHEQDVFPLIDHLVRPLGSGTDFRRGAAFLGREALDRSPRRVTYEVVPAMADPALDLRYDGAYWVDDLVVAEGVSTGLADVVDLAAPAGEPVAAAHQRPGEDPEPHIALGVTWADTTNLLRRNELAATFTGLAAATVDVDRTHLATGRAMTVRVTTDRPVAFRLDAVRSGRAVALDGRAAGRTHDGGVTVVVPAGEHVVAIG